MPSKKKILIALGSSLFLFWMIESQGWESVLPVLTAKAGDAAAPSFSETSFTLLTSIFGFVTTFTHFLIYIVLDWMGPLLDPKFMDLESGTAMANILNQIWQISRNITNIILAFLLIMGGVMTVVFAKGDVIQKHAAKFVIAVILVNFSWFFPRIVLDVSNILTTTIYSIPGAIPDARCKAADEEGNLTEECEIITDYAFFDKNAKDNGFKCVIMDSVCIKTAPLQADANSPIAIVGGIAYNHARLAHIAKVVKDFNPATVGASDMGRIKSLVTFTLLSALVVLFSMMLLFPLLAMTVAFMVRIPVLWLTVAFMPFSFLGYVAGDFLPAEMNPNKIWKYFLQAAFMPTTVAVPIAVGYIMINVGMSSADTTTAAALSIPTGIPLLAGVRDLWQLLWVGMSMGVIWLGAFFALKNNTIAAKVIAPFEQAGKNFGAFMFKLPGLLPLPLPSGAPGGLGGLKLGQVASYMQHSNQFIGTDWKFHIGGPVGKYSSGTPTAGGTQTQVSPPAMKLADHITQNQTVNVSEEIHNAYSPLETNKDDAGAQQGFKNKVQEILQRAGINYTGSIRDLIREVKLKLPNETRYQKFKAMKEENLPS